MHKKIIGAGAVLAILIGVLTAFGVFNLSAPQGPAGSEVAAADIVSVPAIEGTVLEAMYAHQAAGGFTFTGKEHPSLGFFVETINGRGAADGKYWFLYINGESSPTGASDTNVSRGDTIEWRYKKAN